MKLFFLTLGAVVAAGFGIYCIFFRKNPPQAAAGNPKIVVNPSEPPKPE